LGDHMEQSGKAPIASQGAKSKTIALAGILSAVVAVLTFIIIPVPPPVGGFDSSSILILSLPILLGPELGTIIVCIGEFVGTVFLVGVGLGFVYYIPGIVAVRGPEAYLVGKIARPRVPGGLGGKGRELFAATVGPIWETFGFIVANYYLYYLIGGPAMIPLYVFPLLLTLIDLIWVVPAMALIQALRKWVKANYMDEQLGLGTEDGTRKGLFRTSTIFILVSWILLLLVPFLFIGWFPTIA